MLIVESNLTIFSTFSLVLDSGSSAHICIFMQDLIESRGLRHSEMILRVSNGVRVATEAIDVCPLQLSFDFRLVLKDYYYVHAASQNLIFISILV